MNRFIFAALLGYLVGIVSAPKKGSETRQDIKDRLLEFQKVGVDVAEAVQRKKQVLVDTAAPVLEQVQTEGKNLKAEGSEIAQNAKDLFNESYERGITALNQAEQRILDKAAPAISLVKDDANYLKNQGSEIIKKATASFADSNNGGNKEIASEPGFKEASNM